MNKYFAKLSPLFAYTLILSTSIAYASEYTHLNTVVQKAHDHFTKRAVVWSKRLLKGTSTYDVLLKELKSHVDAFNYEVASLVSPRNTNEKTTALFQQAQTITLGLKAMLDGLYAELSKSENYKTSAHFLGTMRKLQGTMSTQLTQLETKLKNFKQLCSSDTSAEAQELRTSIATLERSIANFKQENQNQNMSMMLLARTSTLFKK